MTTRDIRSIALLLALAATSAFAAGSTKAPSKPTEPVTLKTVLSAWTGKAVTLNWYDKDDKKSKRTLIAVGDDYVKLDSDTSDAVYIPLSRLARVEVSGDKLTLVLNGAN